MKKEKKLKKKKMKKSMVYGVTAGVFGAAAAGIIVPIVIEATKINNYNPLPGMKGDTKLTGNLSVDQITNALKSAGIQDQTLITKAERETAFYLYGKEQTASLNYQKMKFRYDQFKQLNAMAVTLASNFFVYDSGTNTIKPGKPSDILFDFGGKKQQITAYDSEWTIKFNDNLVNTDGSPNYNNYQKVYDGLNQQLNNNLKLLEDHNHKNVWKTRIDSLKTNIKNYNKAWNDDDNGLTKKLDKLDKGLTSSDYENSNFATWYPDTLQQLGKLSGSTGNWSGTGVYKKQAQIFMDSRHNFIKNYPTRQAGEAAWAKQLSKQYDGATTEKDAIDSLVYKAIQDQAFARNKFETNGDYTVDMLLSGTFNSILGKFDRDSGTSNKLRFDSSHLEYNYDKTSGNPFSTKYSISEKNPAAPNWYEVNREDKIYFFGTKSKDQSLINLSDSKNLPDIFKNRHMMQVQNAIIGFKQGTTNLDGWTIGKDMLKNLFFVRGDSTGGSNTNLVADAYENIFKSGNEDETQHLIAFYSETKDATQYKSGNLGYMPGLNSTKMVEGFGLGMMAAYDDLANTQPANKWFGSNAITDDPDLLTNLRSAMVTTFIKAANDLGGLAPSGTTVDASIFKQTNQNAIDNFLNSLTSDQIKSYFGRAVAQVFNNIGGTYDKDGIPMVIRISKTGSTGIYAFYDSQYGLHIVKIDTSPFSTSTSVKKDMQKVADKQDTKAASTDYATLYNNNYTLNDQINTLLDPSQPQADVDAFKKYLQDNIKNYTPVSSGKYPIAEDVEKLVTSLTKAENLDRIQKSNWDKLPTYLIKEFDGKLIDYKKAIDPEKIYNAIQQLGGGN